MRHPVLRKSAAVSDEAIEEDNADSVNWGNMYAISDLMQRAVNQTSSSLPPTATIHCTKSEPLSGEDIGILPARVSGNYTISCTNSVQQRTSRAIDIATLASIKCSDALFTEENSGTSTSIDYQTCKNQINADSSMSSPCQHRDGNSTLQLSSLLVPPKSLIQDDIRTNHGRFELVKKKGRSEVWNLFGQVLDTTTGARLPYVACYACKVLYTDTGGGTGNMTRHRCPIGTSYKDSNISSTMERMSSIEQAQHQSFEACNSNNEQFSPDTATTNAEDSSMLNVAHANFVSQSSCEQLTPFSENDRHLFRSAVLRCCALDLLSPLVFKGEGLRSLIETTLSIGQRVKNWDKQSISSLIPSSLTLQTMVDNGSESSITDICTELNQLTTNVSFSVEEIIGLNDHIAITTNYITADWHLKRRIVRVGCRKEILSSLGRILPEYVSSKCIVVSQDELPPNESYQTSLCICFKLNKIISDIFDEAYERGQSITEVIAICRNLAANLKWFAAQRFFEDKTEIGRVDYLFYVYDLLKIAIESVSHSDTLSFVERESWNFIEDLKKFLEPFHVMASVLYDNSVVNFHMILPEWFALIHEFSSDTDEEVVSVWLANVREITKSRLHAETDRIITIEHRVATALNPRLKHLSVVCTDLQRVETYAKIRSLIRADCRNSRTSDGSASDSSEVEPQCKRICFLSSLEDQAIVDDEFESYLRSQFPSMQAKDVLHFWSTAGAAQFPNLALLARSILTIPAACYKHKNHILSGAASDSLRNLLILQSYYTNLSNETFQG